MIADKRTTDDTPVPRQRLRGGHRGGHRRANRGLLRLECTVTMEEHSTDNPFGAYAPRRRRFALRRPRISKWWWLGAGATMAAIGVGFGGGFLSAQLTGQSDALTDEMAELSQQLDQLRQAVGVAEGTGAAGGSAGDDAIELGQSITDRVLGATRATGTERTIRSIESVAALFETDRLLLAEMRKAPPRDPQEARQFWAGIRPLALKSGPAALGPLLDRVERALPGYLEWLASSPGPDTALTLGFLQSGASNYLRAVDEFWQGVLLMVIGRIEVLVDLALG